MKLAGLLLATLLCIPATAFADDVEYLDPHPVAPEAGGGYCYAEGTHFHDYVPPDELAHLYRNCEGRWCFVGDPVPFGYDGEVVAYEDPHPIYLPPEGSFCYLTGLHYHVFMPYVTVLPYFVYYGGILVYRGPFGSVYTRDRAKYDRGGVVSTNYQGTAGPARRYYSSAWRRRLAQAHGKLVVKGILLQRPAGGRVAARRR